MKTAAHWFCGTVLVFLMLTSGGASAKPSSEAGKPGTETPVQLENLDRAAFAEWVGGQENPLSGPEKSQAPQWLIWTSQTHPGHSGCIFGDSRTPGARHLRIGFNHPVAIGSVFVSGGGQLSVLKPGAAYPGNLNNEADWVPAERLSKGEISRDDVHKQQYALWTLPPGTQTRALRFTHIAEAADAMYAGHLGAAFVTSERWSNLAPQAIASASANPQYAGRINEGEDEKNKIWDNLDDRQPAPAPEPVVSPQHPQWLILTWPVPVKIGGLNALGAGFGAAEVQSYAGPVDKHPRDAGEADWKTIGNFPGIRNGYPIAVWPNQMIFGEAVMTRAIRLKMTLSTEEGHPHLKGASKDGKRVWIGELMALEPLGNAPLHAITFPQVAAAGIPHPPIPVPFKLEKAGYVTLVIEDESGKRIRNLISETLFPAGENTAWWDGTDDLGRDVDAAKHGLYNIPAQFVAPGNYRVRGLVRGAIEPRYEFPVYSGGNPAWETADKSGGWLTNHTPPQAALFVPASQAPGDKNLVYLGSYVSEGGAGLAWVDLDGHKQGGRGWIGGNWTAAPYLARDAGHNPLPDAYAYVASVWATEKGSTKAELRITALTSKGDKEILRHEFDPQDPTKMTAEIAGLAVHDGIAIVSLPLQKQLLFVDAKAGKILATAPVDDLRGVAIDREGHLLALAGRKLLRFDFGTTGVSGAPREVIAQGLEDPRGVAIDAEGKIFVSDGGASQQVKVFDEGGQLVQTIGKPGAPAAGPYDPLHMNHPAGMTVDSNRRLWVTENDFLPKRVSVWNPDGTFWKAFYGPAKYGGGGTLDSQDKTRFYYADESRGTMEFKLDWEKGESQLVRVLYRPQSDDLKLAFRSAAPEVAIYREGRRYFTDCYNSSPTNGHGTAYLFLDRDGLAVPVAAMGRADSWDLLKGEAFRSRLPAGNALKDKGNDTFFIWSDLNGDAQVQPEEVTFEAGSVGGVTVMPDLSFCVSRIGGQAMRFAPSGFTSAGVPRYDFANGETLAKGVGPPASSGGDQVLVSSDGWAVITLGIAPFERHSLCGAKNGQALWGYPDLWPGLHASHESPAPDRPGELIGTTRLLGGFVSPKGSDAGEIWGINANMGTIYLFTADGLFVATVFKDVRRGKTWAMPIAERNMSLDGLTLGEENFWPTMSQTPDGQIYLMNGGRASLVRLDGLETVRRLPATSLRISAEDLQKAQAYQVAAEVQRQQNQGRGILEIALRATAPVVNGRLDDWSGAAWVDIDKSGVAANFNSKSKPYDVSAAVAVAGDRLYAAYRTNDEKLLENAGGIPTAPFKTGGALDLMLGVNPTADPKRASPVEGDLRLLVTRVKGKTFAVLYRAVVPGTDKPVPFSSPWRTITLDRVEDVSDQVQLAGSDGNYEFSIPLALLGLKPQAGRTITGDIGILRGDGTQTNARVYWSNKATGITSDVPSEASLTPQLWGRVEFKNRP